MKCHCKVVNACNPGVPQKALSERSQSCYSREPEIT